MLVGGEGLVFFAPLHSVCRAGPEDIAVGARVKFVAPPPKGAARCVDEVCESVLVAAHQH